MPSNMLLSVLSTAMAAGPGQHSTTTNTDGAVHQLWRGSRRFAYVTLLTMDAYVPGVQALARSLHVVGAFYPLVVLYTCTVSQAALDAATAEGCQLRLAEPFKPANIDHSEYKRELYMQCWNKLRMWEMTDYDRLVYLDADMILCRNIDHLFSLPPGFYAVGDCYGGRETEEERTSCCHFRPHDQPAYFNAGFYMMEPDRQELAEMERAMAEGRHPVRFFAEQDFLNGYYAGRWTALPYTYNAQKRIKYHHPNLWCFDDIFIIHYVDEKPWSHRYSKENQAYREECDWWWDVFEGRADMGAAAGAAQAASGKRPPLARAPTPPSSGPSAPLSLTRTPSGCATLERSASLSRAGSLGRAGSLTTALPTGTAR